MAGARVHVIIVHLHSSKSCSVSERRLATQQDFIGKAVRVRLTEQCFAEPDPTGLEQLLVSGQSLGKPHYGFIEKRDSDFDRVRHAHSIDAQKLGTMQVFEQSFGKSLRVFTGGEISVAPKQFISALPAERHAKSIGGKLAHNVVLDCGVSYDVRLERFHMVDDVSEDIEQVVVIDFDFTQRDVQGRAHAAGRDYV